MERPGQRIEWVANLHGLLLMSAKMFANDNGPQKQFQSVLGKQKVWFMSRGFKTNHPVLARLVENGWRSKSLNKKSKVLAADVR